MQDMTEKLAVLLLSDAELARMVGDNIYPIVAPSTSKAPYVIFSLLNFEPAMTLDGWGGQGLWTYQVSVFCAKLEDALAIRSRIARLLDNAAIADGETATLLDLREDFDGPSNLFRADVDFII